MGLVALLLLRGVGVKERLIRFEVGFETTVRMVTQLARNTRLPAIRGDAWLRLYPGLEISETRSLRDMIGRRSPPIAHPRV